MIARVLFLFVFAAGLAAAADVPTERLALQERWRRGTEDDDLIFGALGRVLTDENGNVYALDSQLSEVLVLSPDGEFLRTISGPGEGPGEVNQPADVYYGLGGKVGLLQAFPGKIVQVAPDGTPLDNFPLPTPPGGGFQVVLRAMALEDRIVLSGNLQVADGTSRMQRKYLKSISADGEELTVFHTQDDPFQFGGMEYHERTFVGFNMRWALTDDGRVYAALGFEDYAIHEWAPDGTLLRVLERPDYPAIERTADERKTAQDLYDAIITFNPRSTFEIEDHHMAVAQIFARPNGELWVLSGAGIYRRPEGRAVVLDVFDAGGSFVRQIEIDGPLDPREDSFYFAGDRVFAVTGALGAAMSAMGGGDGDGEDVEPSNLVCFDLVPAP